MRKLFRVYYEETLSYEDYVEAHSEEEAKAIFVSTLETDENFEPLDIAVNEFEAEEVLDDEYHKGKILI